ncbi:alpha/beta hydrolase [Rhizobium cremeum]|uniref:alpha/beta fold hydrolase n=1 Tax=Rhizobium cremeum TaxID=2813827 RepID=UPI000DDDFED8|nr:alpha/beta hydrolase [Rhizobium cremeum]MCJ7994030.1 alpha/beta hydrolase [Rhizobium cremeum]MCJ7999087.1 alpha/beta hydrolase [Rhizobium cremeum]
MDTILHATPLYATPGNPIPGDPVAGFFKGHRGVMLRYAIFRCEQPARGTVVLLHGRNETIEKYFETIRDLNAAGLWVATYDFRGQGGSQRLLKNTRKGHVHRFSDYLRDLDIFLQQIVLPDTRLPFFLLAHSTGGLVALAAAPRLANRIERMVLMSPFVGLGGQKLSPKNIYRLSALMSFTGFGRMCLTADEPIKPFDGNPLTSDQRRFERNNAIFAAHPEFALGPPTARWLYEAQKTIAKVSDPKHLASITVPTVIVAPGNDPIVPFAFPEKLSQYFRAGQLVPVPGARHEILHERDRYRAQALAAFHAFIPGGDENPEEEATGKDSEMLEVETLEE